MKINGLTEEELFLLLVIENFKSDSPETEETIKLASIRGILIFNNTEQRHDFWWELSIKNPTFHHKFM